MRVSFILFTLVLATAFTANAQGKETIETYIATYKELAIEEMLRTGVPASIKLAQGIHETSAGTSELVKKSNNHFGIKCKSNWTGESVSHTDDAPNECFRKYPEASQSYRDHSDFLKNSPRYAGLFKLDPEDYKAWANGLKKAGYATNPRYPQVIIKLIEDYHLQDYTLIALGKMQRPEGEEIAVVAVAAGTETAAAPAIVIPAAEKVAVDYPSGIFHINDTRVTHLPAGTSLLAIAQQHEIPLKRLLEFNELDELESLERDQLIFLQRKRKTGAHDFHFVKTGETLYDIAQTEGIRMEALLELNFLMAGMQPATGEQLYLKRKAPSRPRLAAGDVTTIQPAVHKRSTTN
ncbi:MAG: glucosaminidase domain-containing protein [Chitinophagaceae bacterium]